MEWNRLAVEGLIEAYREENCLYNTKSLNYHNKHYRKEALERITNVLKDVRPSTTGVDIMAKMKSLRTSFVAELNKIKQSTKSGAGSGQIYKPTIWYFEKLQFLRDHVLPRRGTCSADVNLQPDADMVTVRKLFNLLNSLLN